MGARVVLSIGDEIVGEIELDEPLTVVGRHPNCDIVIRHPAISQHHALFRVVGGTVYAEDLGSTNGLKINGVRTSRQAMHHMDQIELGLHKIHFSSYSDAHL